jgi:hypothetical protein
MKPPVMTIAFALFALGLPACTKTETTGSAPADQAATAASEPAVPATAPATAATAPAAAAPAAGTAVATADGEQSGVTLTVTELKRSSGGTVNLKFTIDNASSESLGFGYDFVEKDKGYGDIGGIYLVDQTNKKKYFVARDSEGECVCSRKLSDLPKGEKRSLWAKFPAPPPEVKAISVVVPRFSPMDDVPIAE